MTIKILFIALLLASAQFSFAEDAVPANMVSPQFKVPTVDAATASANRAAKNPLPTSKTAVAGQQLPGQSVPAHRPAAGSLGAAGQRQMPGVAPIALPGEQSRGAAASTANGSQGQVYQSAKKRQASAPTVASAPVEQPRKATPQVNSKTLATAKAGTPSIVRYRVIVAGNPYSESRKPESVLPFGGLNPSLPAPTKQAPSTLPKDLDGGPEKGWETANFTGLGYVEAKITEDNTYIRVAADLAKKAAVVFEKGLTGTFKCGDKVCFSLDNSILKIKR